MCNGQTIISFETWKDSSWPIRLLFVPIRCAICGRNIPCYAFRFWFDRFISMACPKNEGCHIRNPND